MNKLTSSQQFSFCFTIITNLRTPFTLSHHLSNEFNGNLISDVTLGDNGEDEEVPEDPGEEDLEIEVDPPEEQTDEDSANTEVDLRGIDPNVRALINSHQTEREQWKRKMEEAETRAANKAKKQREEIKQLKDQFVKLSKKTKKTRQNDSDTSSDSEPEEPLMLEEMYEIKDDAVTTVDLR